jgi:hypothetical protein
MALSTPSLTSSKLYPEGMPGIFEVADHASLTHQRQYTLEVGLELACIIIAAIAGLLTIKIGIGTGEADIPGLVAGLAFFVGFILQADRQIRQPHRTWYNGRAIAESVKTLAWRYAVGGTPFSKDEDQGKIDSSFRRRILDVIQDIKDSEVTVSRISDKGQISPQMISIRASSWEERKAIYLKERLQDQRAWYTHKANSNKNRAHLWGIMLLITEVLGAVAAFLKATGIIQLDLLGFIAAVAAVITSWSQVRQHQNLSQAYAIAVMELSNIIESIDEPQNENDWAIFVGYAEAAISREHTLWRAQHNVMLKNA